MVTCIAWIFYNLKNLNIIFFSPCNNRFLLKMLNCYCKKKCNIVNKYSTMTVFIEERGARSACSKLLDLIGYLPSAAYKIKKTIE